MANELTRRKFIKMGALLLPAAGILRPSISDARLWMMLGKQSTANISWATWTGTESGFGDSANTFICNSEGSGDEIGQGYTSGLNLVLTDNGTIGAVSGGFRALDGATGYFSMTLGLSNIFTATNTFTAIVQFQNFSQVAGDPLFYFTDAALNNGVYLVRSGANPALLRGAVLVGGVAKLNTTTTDALPAAGTYWAAIGCTGSVYFAGFTNTGSGAIGQPVKWSDFTANNRISNTVAAVQLANNVLDTNRNVGFDGTANYSAFNFGRLILSRSVLISDVS